MEGETLSSRVFNGLLVHYRHEVGDERLSEWACEYPIKRFGQGWDI